MFETITNWIIANKDSLISNVIVSSLFLGIAKLWVLKNKIPNVLKTLINIKGMKYLEFVVLYILPLGTIAAMIIDKTNELTFKNIGLFIIICVTFIYNVLMNHIISLYELNRAIIAKNTSFVNKLNEVIAKKPNS